MRSNNLYELSIYFKLPSGGDSLTNPMLITGFVKYRPKGHQELSNEVGSLCPAEHLMGFEPGSFRF